jgi:hypothetical protein
MNGPGTRNGKGGPAKAEKSEKSDYQPHGGPGKEDPEKGRSPINEGERKMNDRRSRRSFVALATGVLAGFAGGPGHAFGQGAIARAVQRLDTAALDPFPERLRHARLST